MLDKPVINTFAHVKPGDTPWVGERLRDFFLYRDLGVAAAIGGRVLAQLVKANSIELIEIDKNFLFDGESLW